ncbi:MAG: dehypoxanthine futalosine cyclase [Planctomycetaceae bacterium]|nr:dehypoxanthine futalosine cyclase [Planctomycetaceae bacterium]
MNAAAQNRLSGDEALRLLEGGQTADLMARADAVRRRLHGRKTFFVHSLNLNPTNVCENHCELCAFWREKDAPDAYLLSLEQAEKILHAAAGLNLTEVHIVGGIRPELNLAYYRALISLSRRVLSRAIVQGLTAVEVHYLAQLERLPVAEVLAALRDAGLAALPGGGAEIFAAATREKICSHKISADEWLAVHEAAHGIGLASNVTMLFGHLESARDIVDHLQRVRDLQDRTGGFKAFVALPFHPAGARLDKKRGPSGHVIARVVALARLFLDNVPHVRVLANYMDRRLLAALTEGGVDDVGGTSLDERIARAAGASADRQFSTPGEMAAALEALGLEMVLTNSIYEGQQTGVQRGQEEKVPDPALPEALDHAQTAVRLSAQEAVLLHDHAPFQQLGLLAHQRRMQMVPGNAVTFVLDRNISFSNVCEAGCRFCAFHVAPGSPKAFTLTLEEIIEKVAQAKSLGATQILLQGGLNPALDLTFYERMLAAIKARHDIWLHCLSPAEINYVARRAGVSLGAALRRLRAAGLDSLPGGGAEILSEPVRQRVSPRKISAADWLAVMAAAHELGMKTTATMVYGLGETTAQRVEHLIRIRDLQDRTGGFTAFIPWSFQPNATQLALPTPTAVDYLRVVAIARLVLDNVPHLQAGTLTEGPDVAQLALSFGADDFGGVLMEERVIRATGAGYHVTLEDILALIGDTGMTPVQRTTQYETLKIYRALGRRQGFCGPDSKAGGPR